MATLQTERREAWKTLMKQSLHQAVVKVMTEEGPQALTMDHIAQVAGIAKGTLYNYFEDKEDLLHYVIKAILDPLDQEVDRILGSDLAPDQKLQAYARHMLEHFELNRSFLRVLMDPELSHKRMHQEGQTRHQQLVLKVGQVFDQGIKAGIFKDAAPNKLGAMFVMSCMALSMGRVWIEQVSPVEEDARLLIEVFLNGIKRGNDNVEK